MGIGSLAAFLTTVVFLIDVILVAVIRKRVRKATDGDVDLMWGNAVRNTLFLEYNRNCGDKPALFFQVWMMLGAAVASWASIMGACCGALACGKRRFVFLPSYLSPYSKHYINCILEKAPRIDLL
jgi:hypothetical protein